MKQRYFLIASLMLLASALASLGQGRLSAYSKFLFDVAIAGERGTTIRYGNWYGPGWWGGSEDPNRVGMLPPVDALDKIAQKHDFGYLVAEEIGKKHPHLVAYYKAVADAIAVRDAMALPSNPALWRPIPKDLTLARRHHERIAVGFRDFVKNWNALLAAKPTRGLDPGDPEDLEMILAGKVTEKEFETRALSHVAKWEADFRRATADKVAKQKPVAGEKRVDPGVKPTSRWVATGASVWSENPNIDQAIREYAASASEAHGTITPTSSLHSWINPYREGTPRTSLGITWNAPPASLKAGELFVITAVASDRGSSAGAPEGDFVSFGVSLFASHDGKSWERVSSDGRELYAYPHKSETRTYRLRAPTTAYNHLLLDIVTGNIFWGKKVAYKFKWVP